MATTPAATTRRERRHARLTARREARHDRGRSARQRLSLVSMSVLGLVAGLAMIAIAFASGGAPSPTPADAAAVTIARAPADIPIEGFSIGRADAPVTIHLYEDFQCPACAMWGEGVFPSLAANELAAGTARIVFHDMAFLGAESVDAGRAAYAAAQQGRFWDMWATLYANQGRENAGAFSRDRLVAMAVGLGLDMDRFAADIDSEAAEASIRASQLDADRAGIMSTPTLVIGGQALVGVGTYPDVAAAIAVAAGS